VLAVLSMSSVPVTSAVVEAAPEYPWNGLLVLKVWWVTAVMLAPSLMHLQ